jgi:hypothetical protein
MMPDKIRGITIEIGGDTSQLSKSLDKVNKDLRTTQGELRDVDRLLKLDPTNTELLEQKQKLLAKSITQTESKLETLRKTEQSLKDAGVDKNSAQFMALQREIISTESKLASMKKEAQTASVEMQRVAASADQISDATAKAAEKTRALSAAAAAVSVALIGAAYNAAKTADDLNTLSQQSGLATDSLQKMRYAADVVDVSADTIIAAMRRMKKNMASESEGVVEAWDTLGVSVTDTTGDYRDAEEVFYDTIKALSRIPNETERDVLAMQLFGKSADELAGIIDDGGAALRMYGDEAERLGLIMDEKTIAALTEANNQIDLMKQKATNTITLVGAKVLTVAEPALEKILGVVDKVFTALGKLDEGTLSTILTVSIAVAAISPVTKLISDITGGISGMIDKIHNLDQYINSTNGKIFIIIAAITTIVALISKLKDAWGEMNNFEKVISVLGLVTTAALAAAAAMGAFQSAATMGIAAAGIVAGIAAIMGAIESAKKRAGTPMMAAGGSLGSGNAIVGEYGPELLSISGGRAKVQPLTNNTTNNNDSVTNIFKVDDIETYQRIEYKARNQRRTQRMGYVGI